MDRFEYEGKTYVAKDAVSACRDCAFDDDNLCQNVREMPGSECGHRDREDGRDIVWVKEESE